MSIHFLFGQNDPRDPWKDPDDEMVMYQAIKPEGAAVREMVIDLQKENMVIWVGVAKENEKVIGLVAHIVGYKDVPVGEVDLKLCPNRAIQCFYEEHGRWPRTKAGLIAMAVNPMLVDGDDRAFKGLIKELGEDTINDQNLARAVGVLPPILGSYDG